MITKINLSCAELGPAQPQLVFIAAICLFYAVMSKVFCVWVAGQMKTILTCIDITFDLSLRKLRTFVKKIHSCHLYFYSLQSKVFFQAISCGGQDEG